jgi:hypothetical protein
VQSWPRWIGYDILRDLYILPPRLEAKEENWRRSTGAQMSDRLAFDQTRGYYLMKEFAMEPHWAKRVSALEEGEEDLDCSTNEWLARQGAAI